MSRPQPFLIGAPNWRLALEEQTRELGKNFWGGFTPVTLSDLSAIEAALQRKLPDDLRCFLAEIGAGNFPPEFGGGIFTPSEIIEGCAGPLLMLLRSDKWADADDHRKFYVSRGEFNPNPCEFTEATTYYQGVNLLDLIQVGDDGMCCYYQVFCQEAESGSGFCRLTPEGGIEDRSPSFSAGLALMLARFRDLQS